MGFNLKSTLSKISSVAAPVASKLSVVAKPALMLGKTAAMSNPYTAGALIGGTVIMGALTMNKQNTLGKVADKVEDTAKGGVQLIGKAGSAVSSGFSNMMMPIMIVGSLACIFMILKK